MYNSTIGTIIKNKMLKYNTDINNLKELLKEINEATYKKVSNALKAGANLSHFSPLLKGFLRLSIVFLIFI